MISKYSEGFSRKTIDFIIQVYSSSAFVWTQYYKILISSENLRQKKKKKRTKFSCNAQVLLYVYRRRNNNKNDLVKRLYVNEIFGLLLCIYFNNFKEWSRTHIYIYIYYIPTVE